MRRYVLLVSTLMSLVAWAPAQASETITYTYDARGRLIQVSHSGTVNNGKSTTYTFDTVHNRTAKTTT